ncbi:hypothetical protein [Nocardia sp. NRRL S-836]|uniref:hypothetical protein n=1 Tax=Nocardia sp. NRRL S-836 TaxID=1519492 RepID=UPI0006B0372E|nr:hypothetical protein [Nocardia sp. NRRL S-836]KOV84668.1 hypothetical protein ADL03_15400 [Nocardia sp. NRRL S-836]
MGHDTRTGSLDAEIVVEEIFKVLHKVAGFQGMRHMWIANLREWPSKVAPVGEDQTHAATLSLISRAEWPSSELRDLKRELTKLYEAGWCNHSIMDMLDHDPDGRRVAPWNNGRDKRSTGLVKYFRWRVRNWSTEPVSGAATGLAVPVPHIPAVSCADWAMHAHA